MPRLPQHLAKVPVGRERLSREALTAHQRDRIVAAATTVFARRGYQETTIDNIVGGSRASVGSFYSLFDGKEACFLAVYDGIVERWTARVREAIAPAGGDWAKGAYLGLREMLALCLEDPLAARVVLLEAQTAGEAATARYNALLDLITRWLHVGRRSHPEAASLPPTFERASVAGLAFYLQQCLHGSGPSDLEPLMDEAAPLVLEPIVGARELRRLRGELAATR